MVYTNVKLQKIHHSERKTCLKYTSIQKKNMSRVSCGRGGVGNIRVYVSQESTNTPPIANPRSKFTTGRGGAGNHVKASVQKDSPHLIPNLLLGRDEEIDRIIAQPRRSFVGRGGAGNLKMSRKIEQVNSMNIAGRNSTSHNVDEDACIQTIARFTTRSSFASTATSGSGESFNSLANKGKSWLKKKHLWL